VVFFDRCDHTDVLLSILSSHEAGVPIHTRPSGRGNDGWLMLGSGLIWVGVGVGVLKEGWGRGWGQVVNQARRLGDEVQHNFFFRGCFSPPREALRCCVAQKTIRSSPAPTPTHTSIPETEITPLAYPNTHLTPNSQAIASATERGASGEGAPAHRHPPAGLPVRVVGLLQDVRHDHHLPARGHAHATEGAGATITIRQGRDI